MRKLLLTAIAATGLLAGCASDAGLIDRNLFAEGDAGLFDTNGNGVFEQAEYDSFADNNFGTWDVNNDNWLDENEFGAGWSQMGWDDDDGFFDGFDDDANGFLSDDEFFDDDEFMEWDDDADGILDSDEWGV